MTLNMMKSLTDIELVERLKVNDTKAFEELVERYKKMGFSLAYNMSGSVEDAQDISQEAFVIVHSQIHKFRGESSFKTWFYRIIVNLCRGHYRKNRFASFISINFFTKEGDEKTIDAVAETTPENELSTKQLGSAIKNAVKNLPVKQQEVFVMKHFNGMKISEISEVLGCAEGTVKSHLFRAVKKLQEKLKGFYNAV